MSKTDLFIEKCREDAVIPTYANDGDAGMDLYAAEEVIIEPGRAALVPVGIKLAIPYGYEVQIRPRSGISLKTPLRVPNAPGTIDSGYRDEVNVIIYITTFSVSIRRLHDTGRSGWWWLIGLTGIGGIVLLVFYCLDSQPGANKYGPNPKGVNGYSNF